MTYIISILPIFIYLFTLVYLEAFSIIKREMLTSSFLWGAVASILLYYLAGYLDGVRYMPIAEELLKYAFMIYLYSKKRIAFLSDSAIYGASIGASFAIIENILYNYSHSLVLIETLYRGFATSLLHMGMTALAASLLMLLSKWRVNSFASRNPLACMGIAVIPSICLHFIHNRFVESHLISNKISLLIVVFSMFAFFYIFFMLSEKRVSDWLEHTLAQEVQLAASFKAGELINTPEGRFLLSIKQQFKPDVYFDVVIYVNLYLDLSLTAKRFIMQRETEIPISKEDSGKFMEKVNEFYTLRKRIGRLGVFTLRPLVDSSKLDTIINLFR